MKRHARAIWKLGIFVLAGAGLVVTVGCTGNASENWQVVRNDFQNFPADLWQDSKQLVSQKENIAILLISGGASGYVRCDHDDEIANHFDGHHTFGRDFTIAVGSSGNPFYHFTLAGAGYFYGLLAEDDETRQVSRSLLEALSLTGLITTGFKTVAQDHGSNGEPLAWPSGHTSSMITLATVMNEYYGSRIGLSLYALSGLVMYERMETGEHWASDLVFGAAIGYTVGRTVAGKSKLEIFGMDVMPFMDPQSGSSGIVLAKQF